MACSRILVTGAGGFVGGWLVRRLPDVLPQGAEIFAAGAPGGPALDITRPEEVEAVVKAFRPTGLVHLAAVSSPVQARVDARRAWDVNLYGTLNLAEAVLRHAPGARFVFASSSEVYGGSFNLARGRVDETALLDPRNPYAATKAAADLALGQMAEAGLAAVRMRPFNHTGAGQSPDFAVPAFASQIAAAERGERPPTMRVGNLDARRDFLDVRDVVEAYLLALLAPDLPPGLVLNVASGRPRRIGDILGALLAMSDVPITVERDPALTRPSDVPVTAGDAGRALTLLGWRPVVPWETTLCDVLAGFRRGAAP